MPRVSNPGEPSPAGLRRSPMAYRTGRRWRLLGLVLVAVVVPASIGGCTTVGSGPSSSSTASLGFPSPTSSPTAPSESTPTPSSTSPNPTSTGPIPSLTHATGSADLLLRYGQAGWLTASSQAALDQVPLFSLFGDGTAVYATQAAEVASGRPPLLRARLSADQIDALLAFALDAGGLRAARPSYDLPGVADAPTTTFTVDAGAVEKTVRVYALGIPGPAATDDAARSEFVRLADKLSDFAAVVADGQATDAGEYLPQAYRAYLLPGQASGPMRDWPWPELAPADFTARDESGLPSHPLSAAQALRLVATPGSGSSVLVVGPDRAPYLVVLIPLLPDQRS